MCKKSIKNSPPFVKKIEKMKNVMTSGGFFDSHCTGAGLGQFWGKFGEEGVN